LNCLHCGRNAERKNADTAESGHYRRQNLLAPEPSPMVPAVKQAAGRLRRENQFFANEPISAQNPKLDGERTRPGCCFPRPRGKPGVCEIVQDASELREAQGAGREARPATPEGGVCSPRPESSVSRSRSGASADRHHPRNMGKILRRSAGSPLRERGFAWASGS
jgi:hypothetical protein